MDFLAKAKKLKPKLKERIVSPKSVSVTKDDWMKKGNEFMMDFGEHIVGYITLAFNVKSVCGPAPDSPLEIKFLFAEDKREFEEGEYNGNLSSSWFQHETVHIDDALSPFTLPRRYAFRYVKVIFTTNTEYFVSLKYCNVKAVTSADIQ